MENYDIVATLFIIIIANAVKIIFFKRQRRRRQWTRPWIQRRSQDGAHHALLQELITEDPDGFRNFLRFVFVSSTPYTPHRSKRHIITPFYA